jgi:hypothetical protein
MPLVPWPRESPLDDAPARPEIILVQRRGEPIAEITFDDLGRVAGVRISEDTDYGLTVVLREKID